MSISKAELRSAASATWLAPFCPPVGQCRKIGVCGKLSPATRKPPPTENRRTLKAKGAAQSIRSYIFSHTIAVHQLISCPSIGHCAHYSEKSWKKSLKIVLLIINQIIYWKGKLLDSFTVEVIQDFLSLRFYVKSILKNLEVWKLLLLQF